MKKLDKKYTKRRSYNGSRQVFDSSTSSWLDIYVLGLVMSDIMSLPCESAPADVNISEGFSSSSGDYDSSSDYSSSVSSSSDYSSSSFGGSDF